MNKNQPTCIPQRSQRPQQPPLPPGQPLPQPAQPDHPAVRGDAQHPQQSVQAPLAPAYNPQWMASQLPQTPLPEQSALYPNYDDDPQWQRQQLEYRQHQYHGPPPVAQLSPQPAGEPGYNPYQPAAGYRQHCVSQPVTSPQPQLPNYARLQPQQQHLRNTPPQDLMPARRQRFDGPNLNRQAQHHASAPPQPQPRPPPRLAQNTRVYPNQNQGLGRGDGSAGRKNAQRSVNTGVAAGNRGGMSGRVRGTRRGSMSGNRGGIADRGRGDSYVGSGGGKRRGGQSGGGVHPHGSGGNFGEAASMQDESPNIIEPVTGSAVTQFQGAQGFNINGNPRFTNIGMNTGNLTTVNNYGATHGLENLKEFVSFAALHDSAEQDPYRRCHPGTREHVLTRLRHWIDNPNPTDRIFWLYGPAGAGKSAIAQTIAHGYKKGEVAATFFFYRSDPTRNDGNRLFTTVAWQLAFSIAAVKHFIVDALDKTPHLPRKDVETQFEQLVAHPMNNVTSQMPYLAPVVIIDGVDECFNEQLQRRLLTVIGNAVKDCCVPLRFLICSRPEALIEETLNQSKDFTLRTDLATLDDSNRDIEKYLVDQFSVIMSKQGLNPSWPGQEIIEEIVFKSSGNFILASTLIRFIGDEDHSAVSQLDIVRKLKPHGTMSPFALLDELYLEILNRQLDQDFLKNFLALLVGYISLSGNDLHDDDAMLMNVSEKELQIKLRRMRSLLKFEPCVDVYHRSFLDFLQDSSRSGQYHVSNQGGLKRYLELIVDSVVRHVLMAIEQPKCHVACDSRPRFKDLVSDYPSDIDLPVEDWQEALKPLVDLQDKLLKISRPVPCCVIQVMRDLLLQLVVLQRNPHCIAAAQPPESNMTGTVTAWNPALVIAASENTRDEELDSCLSVLLSCLRKTNFVECFKGVADLTTTDMAITDHMSSLLIFDHAETAAKVRSVSDAQILIDFIDLLTNNESILSQCGPDARCKAAHLASEIFARVPVLPRSLFLNGPCHYSDEPLEITANFLELACQTALFCRILDHTYIIPPLEIYVESHGLKLICGDANEQYESLKGWLERSNPNFVTRIQVTLEVARAIRYTHSMDIGLCNLDIVSRRLTLDSNLRPKIVSEGSFTWWLREALSCRHEISVYWPKFTYESNISAFADLFDEVCFHGNDENISNRLVEDARQIIERCRAKDPKSQPTMEDVVKEMESWDLT